MEEIQPLRARIYAILRNCNLEETKRVLEFCEKLKPPVVKKPAPMPVVAKPAPVAPKPAPITPIPIIPTPTHVAGAPKDLSNVVVDYLCGKWMHTVGQVAQWTYDTYFKGQRPESYEKVLAATKICYAGMLPVRLIAANGSDLVGSMSMVKHEQNGRSLTPLLTFMCVPNEYKNMGIESKLIKQGVQVLRGLGYKEAYIKIENHNLLPIGMQWVPVDGCSDIYKYTAQNTAPIY